MENCLICQKLKRESGDFDNPHWSFYFLPTHKRRGVGIFSPRKHIEKLSDLTSTDWQTLTSLYQEVEAFLSETLAPGGMSLALNIGPVSGQVQKHLHWFCVPRFENEVFSGLGVEKWLLSSDNRRQKDLVASGEWLENIESFLKESE